MTALRSSPRPPPNCSRPARGCRWRSGSARRGWPPAAAQPGGVAPADAFRLLGLWQGPSISAAAAAALFGTPEYLAADAHETLVDAHLLESTGSDRYKFHDRSEER